MPIPSPNKETRSEFLQRCMGDSVMNKEFDDPKQRYAVCLSKWESKKKEGSATLIIDGEETVFFAPKGDI